MAPPTGPSPDEWEAVKTKIYQLYFDSTLKNVMEKMKTDYGFVASKNQYERKLKEWGFRKNLSLEERFYAIRTVRKRKAEDKASQVKWQGLVLSEKKLKKLDRRVPLI
ncbi:hypothetical protein HYALB_00005251 [Hymenoscyphus albidus]|uniref:Clr5 domain-containing protein n=1 Tax=Hymenoscyphus albidus TaxID=595503 RepID=A0A9N9Q8D8_9HELO|nr:hypothetical protein HYALB_00005251 [Hymenoscyphus albidus]